LAENDYKKAETLMISRKKLEDRKAIQTETSFWMMFIRTFFDTDRHIFSLSLELCSNLPSFLSNRFRSIK